MGEEGSGTETNIWLNKSNKNKQNIKIRVKKQQKIR